MIRKLLITILNIIDKKSLKEENETKEEFSSLQCGVIKDEKAFLLQ